MAHKMLQNPHSNTSNHDDVSNKSMEIDLKIFEEIAINQRMKLYQIAHIYSD